MSYPCIDAILAGVALGMQPPRWLKAGDEVRVEIEGLGELRQRVVAV